MKCKNAVKRGTDSLQNVAYFSNSIFFCKPCFEVLSGTTNSQRRVLNETGSERGEGRSNRFESEGRHELVVSDLR